MRKKRRTYVPNYSPEVDLMDDDFADNMQTYLNSLLSAGRSAYTIEYYRTKLRYFMRYLEGEGISTRLRKITSDILESDFIRHLREDRKLKHGSIAAYLRALRAFFNWAVSRGIIATSPLDDIVIGDPKTPAIETFSRDQLHAILSQPDPQLFIGLRDLTIMTLLLETGVRVREMCDIKVEDVRFTDNQIRVEGKSGNDRLVPIQTQSRRLLKRYIDARGEADVDYLFVTVDDTKMNRDSVRKRIAIYGRQANIKNVRCSPHTFRHTFAKMSVQNGADLFTLQAILGHSTLDMVRRYVNMFGNDVKEAHAKFSPVENLRLRF